MKKTLYKSFLPYLMIAIALISGCAKEEEPIIPEVIPEATEVNSFIWNGLSDYYLWNSQVAGLTNSKYEKKDSLNAFLNTYTDPQKLFTSLLYKYKEVDKWSFLVDDSKEIDDWIAGISETIGYDFMLGRIGSSNDLFGFVRYVYKGSPAEKAGVKRGDIFMKVNDQQLTVSNYQTLLFATKTYTLSFATISNSTISLNNRVVLMTAVEMQENPISKDTIFIFNNQKIGYLVYNGFNSDFDIQLNDVFKKFKVANIDRLVLDLRYNSGGSVQSSIYLASMIYGTDATKVFAKAKYNAGLQKYLVSEYGLASLNDNFTTSIEKNGLKPATTINTLNLNKIHIIVSDNTASASEMLINGLRPYMNVTVVGINTNGKYTGSMTVKDWDEKGVVNPNHKWAMQPIVVKYANSRDESDYVNGLTPNIISEEDFVNLLPFGDPNETLLSVVLSDIKGIPVTGMVLKSAKMGLLKVSDSRDFKPFANEMYINPDKFQNLKK
ncbi:MAG: S41 family peptidase [Bacteroidota bacterium]|nr:S41 family peptidase [Bacteroidota bacterium]